MARPRADSCKVRLQKLLAELKPRLIDEQLLVELKAALSPVSDSYLRHLLRSSGIPLAPLVESVNQHSLADLERTLVGLLDEYESGDLSRRKRIRAMVIEAKDRLKWSARREGLDETVRSEKAEMLLWMLTWLENPESFRVWVQLRRARLKALAPRFES